MDDTVAIALKFGTRGRGAFLESASARMAGRGRVRREMRFEREGCRYGGRAACAALIVHAACAGRRARATGTTWIARSTLVAGAA